MSKKYYLGVDDIKPIYESFCGLPDNLKGIQVRFNGITKEFPCNKYEYFVPEECKKQAQNEVWEFVKLLYHKKWDWIRNERYECFGCVIDSQILDLGYEKAKEMYDAWVKKNTVKEMTVEEVSKALGYKVKIVSKED